MKIGAVSEDFPLYHNNYIPTYKNPNDKHSHKKSKVNNIYTNEHPDIFRLDGMKEGGLTNPFMNQLIKIDRNEYFKKLSLDRKNINFIDFIKSNRNFSQNQKITRYISNDTNMELRRKRMAQKNKNLSYLENNSNYKNNNNYNNNILLTEEKKIKIKNEYNNLLKTLNSFVPKINYKTKKYLKISDELNKNNNNSNIENENFYKKLINKNLNYCNNLRNINNFKINKQIIKTDNDNNYFSFERKKGSKYNPIIDEKTIIELPPYKKEKWSPFLENYFLMSNTRNKFQRKGGLLTEFCNKNINSINNEKIEKKLKKQKLQENK